MRDTIVLEPSTTTHIMKANLVEQKDLGNGIIMLEVKGEGVVTHGRHHTIKTESEHIIKYVQQECNPITKKMMNSYD